MEAPTIVVVERTSRNNTQGYGNASAAMAASATGGQGVRYLLMPAASLGGVVNAGRRNAWHSMTNPGRDLSEPSYRDRDFEHFRTGDETL